MHQHIKLEEIVYFWFAANDTSGSGNDGASPVFDVRLAGGAVDAAPILSDTANLLTHANYPAGCHEIEIEATTANGFVAGQTYGVFCTLAVDGQNPTGFVGSFTIKPIVANVEHLLGTLLTEGASGRIAAGFKKLFDVAAPVLTAASVNQTGDNYSRLGAPAGASVSADIAAVKTDTGNLANQILLMGTASAGSATSITLTGGVATDRYYDGQLVAIVDGTGTGQARTIIRYVGATRVATITRDWAVAPDATSVFVVLAADVPAILEAGDAQGGAAGSITLDAGASAIDDTYVRNFVMITGGTGIGQARLISTYNGTTKIAGVLPDWTTTPDATSVYQILPGGRVDIGGWAGTVVSGTLFTGITSLAEWLGLIAGKQTGDATARTELRATGAGSGTFDETTDSQEAIRDRGDAAWATATGFMPDTEDGSSFNAIPDMATATNQATIAGYIDTEIAAIITHLTDIKGATFDGGTDSLEAIRNQGDAAWITATGFSTHDAAAVKTALEADGSKLDHLWEMTEDDGGVRRLTANALEQGPSGSSDNTLLNTTIAAVTDQTHFTLTAGSDDDGAYEGQAIVLYDASDNDDPSVRICETYTGATKSVVIDGAPDFTIIAGDGVKVFVTPPGTTAPTVGQIRAEMETAGGKLDNLWGTKENAYHWYVAKNGNDANGGGSWHDAFLTIAAAIAAASGGDTIHVGPGTWNEVANLTGLADITLQGSGRTATIITNATDAHTVYTTHDATIRDLTAANTHLTSNKAAICVTGRDTWIERVIGDGKYDGLQATGSTVKRLRLRDSLFKGTYDGGTVLSADEVFMENCDWYTDSSYNSGGQDTKALHASSTVTLIAKNCHFTAYRSDTTAFNTIALNQPANAVLDGCTYKATQANAGGTGHCIGIKDGNYTARESVFSISNAATATGKAVGLLQSAAGDAVIIGAEFSLSAASGLAYRFQQTAGNIYHSLCTGTPGNDSGTIRKTDPVYYADIRLERSWGDAQDEWTVQWFLDEEPLSSGITNAKIQVINRSNGSDLVALADMTQIGTSGRYKYDEATNRITPGDSVIVIATATIDGATHTWSRVLGRDG